MLLSIRDSTTERTNERDEMELELGSFSLLELGTTIMMGIPIERDKYFPQTPLSVIRAECEARRRA